MDWTYRMLGREHEVDLEREALKWQRAAQARAPQRPSPQLTRRSKLRWLVPARAAGFFARLAAR